MKEQNKLSTSKPAAKFINLGNQSEKEMNINEEVDIMLDCKQKSNSVELNVYRQKVNKNNLSAKQSQIQHHESKINNEAVASAASHKQIENTIMHMSMLEVDNYQHQEQSHQLSNMAHDNKLTSFIEDWNPNKIANVHSSVFSIESSEVAKRQINKSQNEMLEHLNHRSQTINNQQSAQMKKNEQQRQSQNNQNDLHSFDSSTLNLVQGKFKTKQGMVQKRNFETCVASNQVKNSNGAQIMSSINGGNTSNLAQMLLNEELKSTHSIGRNSVQSNKSIQSRVSRYSKTSKNSMNNKRMKSQNVKKMSQLSQKNQAKLQKVIAQNSKANTNFLGQKIQQIHENNDLFKNQRSRSTKTSQKVFKANKGQTNFEFLMNQPEFCLTSGPSRDREYSESQNDINNQQKIGQNIQVIDEESNVYQANFMQNKGVPNQFQMQQSEPIKKITDLKMGGAQKPDQQQPHNRKKSSKISTSQRKVNKLINNEQQQMHQLKNYMISNQKQIAIPMKKMVQVNNTIDEGKTDGKSGKQIDGIQNQLTFQNAIDDRIAQQQLQYFESNQRNHVTEKSVDDKGNEQVRKPQNQLVTNNGKRIRIIGASNSTTQENNISNKGREKQIAQKTKKLLSRPHTSIDNRGKGQAVNQVQTKQNNLQFQKFTFAQNTQAKFVEKKSLPTHFPQRDFNQNQGFHFMTQNSEIQMKSTTNHLRGQNSPEKQNFILQPYKTATNSAIRKPADKQKFNVEPFEADSLIFQREVSVSRMKKQLQENESKLSPLNHAIQPSLDPVVAFDSVCGTQGSSLILSASNQRKRQNNRRKSQNNQTKTERNSHALIQSKAADTIIQNQQILLDQNNELSNNKSNQKVAQGPQGQEKISNDKGGNKFKMYDQQRAQQLYENYQIDNKGASGAPSQFIIPQNLPMKSSQEKNGGGIIMIAKDKIIAKGREGGQTTIDQMVAGYEVAAVRNTNSHSQIVRQQDNNSFDNQSPLLKKHHRQRKSIQNNNKVMKNINQGKFVSFQKYNMPDKNDLINANRQQVKDTMNAKAFKFDPQNSNDEGLRTKKHQQYAMNQEKLKQDLNSQKQSLSNSAMSSKQSQKIKSFSTIKNQLNAKFNKAENFQKQIDQVQQEVDGDSRQQAESIERNILLANIRQNTSLLQSLSINNSQTSQKSFKSNHSRKSKQSRQSRVSKHSQKKRMVSRVVSNNQKKWSVHNNTNIANLLNIRKQVSESVQTRQQFENSQERIETLNEYESVQNIGKFDLQGNQSTSSKVQKKLILQKSKQAIPHTVTNQNGGPKLLNPSPLNNKNGTFQRNVNESQEINSENNNAHKSSQYSKQSKSLKQGKKKKMKTKEPSQRQSRVKSFEKGKRDSLELNIPPSVSFMEPHEHDSRRTSNNLHIQNEGRSMNNSSIHGSVSPNRQEKQVKKFQDEQTKFKFPPQEANQNEGQGSMSKSKDATSIFIQDQKTPKTFLFNNPTDIQKQEINLKNLIDNSQMRAKGYYSENRRNQEMNLQKKDESKVNNNFAKQNLNNYEFDNQKNRQQSKYQGQRRINQSKFRKINSDQQFGSQRYPGTGEREANSEIRRDGRELTGERDCKIRVISNSRIENQQISGPQKQFENGISRKQINKSKLKQKIIARTLSQRDENSMLMANAFQQQESATTQFRSEAPINSYLQQVIHLKSEHSEQSQQYENSGAKVKSLNNRKRNQDTDNFSAYENSNVIVKNKQNQMKSNLSGSGQNVKARRNIMQINWSSDKSSKQRCFSEKKQFININQVNKQYEQRIRRAKHEEQRGNHQLANQSQQQSVEHVFSHQQSQNDSNKLSILFKDPLLKQETRKDQVILNGRNRMMSDLNKQTKKIKHQANDSETNIIYNNFEQQDDHKIGRRRGRLGTKQQTLNSHGNFDANNSIQNGSLGSSSYFPSHNQSLHSFYESLESGAAKYIGQQSTEQKQVLDVVRRDESADKDYQILDGVNKQNVNSFDEYGQPSKDQPLKPIKMHRGKARMHGFETKNRNQMKTVRQTESTAFTKQMIEMGQSRSYKQKLGTDRQSTSKSIEKNKNRIRQIAPMANNYMSQSDQDSKQIPNQNQNMGIQKINSEDVNFSKNAINNNMKVKKMGKIDQNQNVYAGDNQKLGDLSQDIVISSFENSQNGIQTNIFNVNDKTQSPDYRPDGQLTINQQNISGFSNFNSSQNDNFKNDEGQNVFESAECSEVLTNGHQIKQSDTNPSIIDNTRQFQIRNEMDQKLIKLLQFDNLNEAEYEQIIIENKKQNQLKMDDQRRHGRAQNIGHEEISMFDQSAQDDVQFSNQYERDQQIHQNSTRPAMNQKAVFKADWNVPAGPNHIVRNRLNAPNSNAHLGDQSRKDQQFTGQQMTYSEAENRNRLKMLKASSVNTGKPNTNITKQDIIDKKNQLMANKGGSFESQGHGQLAQPHDMPKQTAVYHQNIYPSAVVRHQNMDAQSRRVASKDMMSKHPTAAQAILSNKSPQPSKRQNMANKNKQLSPQKWPTISSGLATSTSHQRYMQQSAQSLSGRKSNRNRNTDSNGQFISQQANMHRVQNSRVSAHQQYSAMNQALNNSLKGGSVEGRPQNNSQLQQSYSLQLQPMGNGTQSVSHVKTADKIKINTFSTRGAGRGANAVQAWPNTDQQAQLNVSGTFQDQQIYAQKQQVVKNNNDRLSQQSRGSKHSPVVSNRAKMSAQGSSKNKTGKNVGSLSMFNAVKGIAQRVPTSGSNVSPVRSLKHDQISMQRDKQSSPAGVLNQKFEMKSNSLKLEENQVRKVLNHMCTVIGNDFNDQAHRGEITSLCLAHQSAMLQARNPQIGYIDKSPEGIYSQINRSNYSKMKIFTASKDATLKCWQFELNDVGVQNQFNDRPSHSQNIGYIDQQYAQIQHMKDQIANRQMNRDATFVNDFHLFGKNKIHYKHSQIQPSQPRARANKRNKTNALAYFEYYDILVSGGTDRFINIYQGTSQMGPQSDNSNEAINPIDEKQDQIGYTLLGKIAKQSANSQINAMCALENDKILIGQSDEYIRLYNINQVSSGSDISGYHNRNNMSNYTDKSNQSPIASYKFEDSGINNLCSLNNQNLFISSALNRSISVWDTRQLQPILYFKDIHYDTITSIDKLNQQIFASASDDGYVNLWDLRMGEFIKQLKVENNERITVIKFINSNQLVSNGMGSLAGSQSSDRSGGNSSQSSSLKNQHLLIAHSDKISIFSARDNFSKRHTFKINCEGQQQFGFNKISDNAQIVTPDSFPSGIPTTQATSSNAYYQQAAPYFLNNDGANNQMNFGQSKPGLKLTLDNDRVSALETERQNNLKITHMEYNPFDSCLYLALSGSVTDGGSSLQRQLNTISIWNLDLSSI